MHRRQFIELIAAILRVDGRPDFSDWDDPKFWRNLLQIADLHTVAQALPRGLARHGIWDKLPADVSNMLGALRDLNLERNTGLKKQGLEVLDLLQKSGIKAVPLKGFAYFLTGLYDDDLGQRLTADIDILVSNSDVRRAQELLISSGYQPPPDEVVDERIRHHLPTLIPATTSQNKIPVDVHFRLGNWEDRDLLPVENILSDAKTLDIGEKTIFVPTYSDLLDHAVVHTAMQNGLATLRTLRLRNTQDIGRLWDAARGDGIRVSDLRIFDHPIAAKHFGASLLVYGIDSTELGTLETMSKHHLRSIMRRQYFRERPQLEASVVSNTRLLMRRPRQFAAKFLRANPYKTAKQLLKKRGA